MSDAARQELAAAASTVTGITGHPKYVQTTRPGSVLVRRNRTEYPNRFGGVAFWDLYVVGPQDFGASETYFETVVPQLVEALAPVLAVTVVTYQLTDFGQGSIPTAVISGHREEEE